LPHVDAARNGCAGKCRLGIATAFVRPYAKGVVRQQVTQRFKSTAKAFSMPPRNTSRNQACVKRNVARTKESARRPTSR